MGGLSITEGASNPDKGYVRPVRDGKNEGLQRRVCAIFFNNEKSAYYPREVTKKIRETDYTNQLRKDSLADSVNKACQRLEKKKILRKLTDEIHKGMYTLYRKELAESYLIRRTDYGVPLAPPQIQHHKGEFPDIIPIPQDRFEEIKKYAEAPSKDDRARQWKFRTKNITVIIYETTICGKFYVHHKDWAEDVRYYFGKDVLIKLERQRMDIGIAIDFKKFLGWKLSSGDIDIGIDGSQLDNGEICIHGKEDEVKAQLHNLITTRTELTTHMADLSELYRKVFITHQEDNKKITYALNSIFQWQVSNAKNDKKLADMLLKIDENIDEKLEKVAEKLSDKFTESLEGLFDKLTNKIIESLSGEADRKPIEPPPFDDDNSMFG